MGKGDAISLAAGCSLNFRSRYRSDGTAKGESTLMLFSVVDDWSGVDYQEYRCVYGEASKAILSSSNRHPCPVGA